MRPKHDWQRSGLQHLSSAVKQIQTACVHPESGLRDSVQSSQLIAHFCCSISGETPAGRPRSCCDVSLGSWSQPRHRRPCRRCSLMGIRSLTLAMSSQSSVAVAMPAQQDRKRLAAAACSSAQCLKQALHRMQAKAAQGSREPELWQLAHGQALPH